MVDVRYSKEAGLLAGRGSHHNGVIMKPEGSLKISVLNGIYQLSDAEQASKNVHPHTHAGQIVHVEGNSVF